MYKYTHFFQNDDFWYPFIKTNQFSKLVLFRHFSRNTSYTLIPWNSHKGWVDFPERNFHHGCLVRVFWRVKNYPVILINHETRIPIKSARIQCLRWIFCCQLNSFRSSLLNKTCWTTPHLFWGHLIYFDPSSFCRISKKGLNISDDAKELRTTEHGPLLFHSRTY